jgi:hypothetical protein
MTSPQKSPYEIFRSSKSGKCLVIQKRDLVTGEPIPAPDLRTYVALDTIRTPFDGITIKAGSRIILADDAAVALIANGGIQLEAPEVLIYWKDAAEAKQAEKYESRRNDRQLVK